MTYLSQVVVRAVASVPSGHEVEPLASSLKSALPCSVLRVRMRELSRSSTLSSSSPPAVSVSTSPRLTFCTSTTSNSAIEAGTEELAATLAVDPDVVVEPKS